MRRCPIIRFLQEFFLPCMSCPSSLGGGVCVHTVPFRISTSSPNPAAELSLGIHPIMSTHVRRTGLWFPLVARRPGEPNFWNMVACFLAPSECSIHSEGPLPHIYCRRLWRASVSSVAKGGTRLVQHQFLTRAMKLIGLPNTPHVL